MKFLLEFHNIALAALMPFSARVLAGAINHQQTNTILYEAFILAFICVSTIYLFNWLPIVYHNYFDGNVSGGIK